MIHIVTSRLPGDKHNWMLVRGEKLKCALCGYIISAKSTDILILRSGCPKSEVVLEAQNAC